MSKAQILAAKQERMRKRNSFVDPSCTDRKVGPKKEIEFVGPKTRRQLIREGLSTRVRELKARLDQFEERKREQNQRDYVVPITIVSRQEMDRL
jgi:hypothetical protein